MKKEKEAAGELAPLHESVRHEKYLYIRRCHIINLRGDTLPRYNRLKIN